MVIFRDVDGLQELRARLARSSAAFERGRRPFLKFDRSHRGIVALRGRSDLLIEFGRLCIALTGCEKITLHFKLKRIGGGKAGIGIGQILLPLRFQGGQGVPDIAGLLEHLARLTDAVGPAVALRFGPAQPGFTVIVVAPAENRAQVRVIWIAIRQRDS